MLRVVTVGSGRWGCIHASKIAAHPHAALVGMVDLDLGRAMEARDTFGARAAARQLHELEQDFDAVTVAVPIGELAAVAMAALELGKPLLLEKPGGVSRSELSTMSLLAQRQGVPVFVGYLERFNGAIRHLKRPAQQIAMWRGGPRRVGGSSLAMDWTCHDINLAQYLTGDPLGKVQWLKSNEQRVGLRLSGHGGQDVRIHTACNATRIRRKLWVDGVFIDLMEDTGDALGAQIDAFVGRVNGHRCSRLSSLEDAMATMTVLEQLTWARAPAVRAS